MMYMKSKKVYIGISIGAILEICIIVASIFYIKTKNKDVEQADFTKNITNEDTKEAMEITEEKDEAKEVLKKRTSLGCFKRVNCYAKLYSEQIPE